MSVFALAANKYEENKHLKEGEDMRYSFAQQTLSRKPVSILTNPSVYSNMLLRNKCVRVDTYLDEDNDHEEKIVNNSYNTNIGN